MGVGHAPNLGADPIYFLWQLRHNTVNVWPLEADPTITYSMPSSWLYLNPRATHRLRRGSVNLFRANNRHGTYIDDFADDELAARTLTPSIVVRIQVPQP
jgi:hypothetical protein